MMKPVRSSRTIWSMMPNRPIEASMASPSCAFGLAGSAWRWSSGMYSVRRGATVGSADIGALLGEDVDDGDVDDRRRVSRPAHARRTLGRRSEEHTSELQSLMRISYAVFCLKKNTYKHD